MSLRFLTAGESHGIALTGIIDGMPAGVKIAPADFAAVLKRRRAGYGRGARQQVEADEVRVTAGLRGGYTTGAPIALHIENAVHHELREFMHPFAESDEEKVAIPVPLPGHADLAGAVKYGLNDCRNIRERASARETVMRTALSVPPRCLLRALGIESLCLLEQIASVVADIDYQRRPTELAALIADVGDDFMTPDKAVVSTWKSLVDSAAAANKSLGGTAAVIFWNLPVGLGSHSQHDLRLDARLAASLMSIPAIRGVEVGFAQPQAHGLCQAADPVAYSSENGWSRLSNYAGGLEAGMSNGAPLIMRFHMKPLPANAGLPSVDLRTGEPAVPAFYRSDTQALTAAAVVAESVVAVELASQLLVMTGGNTLAEVHTRLEELRHRQQRLP
ncbi:MAG: chorismate synthase [Candidatus Riflebacteria bacterium HGW-Riflebacteria-2]|jgi:chorismate synthase|nr:MAG: chorismate synthase [Candidatus Riflebacteria bacterium HGW-Riflebacteria-2]